MLWPPGEAGPAGPLASPWRTVRSTSQWSTRLFRAATRKQLQIRPQSGKLLLLSRSLQRRSRLRVALSRACSELNPFGCPPPVLMLELVASSLSQAASRASAIPDPPQRSVSLVARHPGRKFQIPFGRSMRSFLLARAPTCGGPEDRGQGGRRRREGRAAEAAVADLVGT
eukprot:3118509-Alexandrium_andersonii.AAC.1